VCVCVCVCQCRYVLYDETTSSIVYGMQPRAVQSMLDYDHSCQRAAPSVVAMVYPFGDNHFQKFYWGAKEVLVPVYNDAAVAMRKHPEVDTVVNFSSFRSVLESTEEVLALPGIRTIAIIAEGVPEQHAKRLRRASRAAGVAIIGPATVGGIAAGRFKVGNTGGMLDNIIGSRLYRPGSVAYVSKSGGMSNELNNMLARSSDGTLEGVAIGGDRYPGTTFVDHLLRYEANPEVKMMVLLGEVGGAEEYKVCEALRDGRLTKPLVAWCIGTCAKMFTTEVQFGHAGALAHSDTETADAKNAALREAGAVVPETFDDLPEAIRKVFDALVAAGTVVVRKEPRVPHVPIDFKWAQELGLVRKPSTFISTISDERGEELLYAGVPISEVLNQDLGIGGVISLLWFKRSLPRWATKFIEILIIIMSDHGPAVSGAHNTIVTARAGKDLVSSLCSGLLTIGDRFGGALDGAAEAFGSAHAKGISPRDFVDSMRAQKRLIPGIGHRVKSVDNPDARVTLLKRYVRDNFPNGGAAPLLDYALEVEKITTTKRANLILNVDGVSACACISMFRATNAFTPDEIDELISCGTLNGMFVAARSIGFIGHFLDQKRLKSGLYRTEAGDVLYAPPHPNDNM
jgi:ATP citrate (pro-S)-lyase